MMPQEDYMDVTALRRQGWTIKQIAESRRALELPLLPWSHWRLSQPLSTSRILKGL